MLQAYVDASGKGDSRFLVIAGFIADADVWADFSKEWKIRLNQAGREYFKMNEMVRSPEIAGYFYRTIEEFTIKASIACVINTKELVEVERSVIYPSNISNPNSADNPYYWGFKYITGLLAERQNLIGLNEPIDFVFDDESEKVKIPHAWDLMKIAAQPETARFMGDTPIFRDDKKVMPLQAADLYAWWAFKWQREGVRDWATLLPFPWGAKKNIPRIAAYFGRRSFLFDISKTLEVRARNDSELEYAKSLMPSHWEESAIINEPLELWN